ncbi:MAG TPA: M48 family metalloprotease [Candidatus Binatia bacterium]|nr:M48 family metalloprotease [Candidatus Binatia bacterium]
MTPAGRSALLIVAAAVACFAASAVTKGDPLFLVEAVGVVLVTAWALVAVMQIGRSAALARELREAGVRWSIAGVECCIVPGGRPRAFVAGAWRPAVFVTTGALDVLTPDELRAVVLHEAHHARSFAPVRAALVEAWRGAGQRAPWLGDLLAARLTALEVEADRFALSAGTTRRHLASALVRLEGQPGGVGFNGGGDNRLRALLDDAASPPRTAPVEWLPLLVLLALAVGCRLAGTAVGV